MLPTTTLMPTVNIARVAGWSEGGKPKSVLVAVPGDQTWLLPKAVPLPGSDGKPAADGATAPQSDPRTWCTKAGV